MKAMLLRPGLFLLALICFVLPFQEFSCSHRPYIHVKGIDLAFGAKVDSNMLVPEYRSFFNDSATLSGGIMQSQSKEKLQVIDVAPLVLAAFICCALAMLISLLIVKPGGSWLAALMGIAAIVLLLIYYFNQMKTNDQKSSILDVSTSFLYGFWLIIIMTALASLASVLFALRRPSEQEIITTVPPMNEPPETMDL